MSIFIAALVFVLFSAGLYLLMRRHSFEVLLGILVLSHGTNLLLISMGGWRENERPPIVDHHSPAPPETFADPIPQALILTAIVIGFAVAAFLIVLIARNIEEDHDVEIGERSRNKGEA